MARRLVVAVMLGIGLLGLHESGCQQIVFAGELQEPASGIFDDSTHMSAENYFKHGHDFEKQGDLDSAIVAYTDAIQLNGNVSEYHFRLGKILESRGDLDAAIASYREAVRLKPESERYRAALAEAMVLLDLHPK